MVEKIEKMKKYIKCKNFILILISTGELISYLFFLNYQDIISL